MPGSVVSHTFLQAPPGAISQLSESHLSIVRSHAFHAIHWCPFHYQSCSRSARMAIVFIGGTPLICMPRHGDFSICDVGGSHSHVMFQFGVMTVTIQVSVSLQHSPLI
jgi:hypothetical protein